MVMMMATNCSSTRSCISFWDRFGDPPRIMLIRPISSTTATAATATGSSIELRKEAIRVKCEAASLRLCRRDGCVLHVSRRRRLGDRQPYRAVDADGAVSVPDRADVAGRLLRLQGAGRPSRGADVASVAATGRRLAFGRNPRCADHD